jgi:hypothetical protein
LSLFVINSLGILCSNTITLETSYEYFSTVIVFSISINFTSLVN